MRGERSGGRLRQITLLNLGRHFPLKHDDWPVLCSRIKQLLKAAGINDSWSSLRQTLSVQRRVTANFRRDDGLTVDVRKSTQVEPALLAIYRALGVNSAREGQKNPQLTAKTHKIRRLKYRCAPVC